jgi:hypothetical protein
VIIENVKAKIYMTIILAVVLYGCETWSLKPMVGHRFRVQPEAEKMTGGSGIFLNETL